MSMTTEFDFRAPPPGDLIRRLTSWLADACRRTVVPWGQLLPFPATCALGTVAAATAGTAVANLPAESVGYRLIPEGDPSAAFLLAVPRPLILALLAGLMSEVPTALPADRDLTSVEIALSEFMLKELFLTPLAAAWPLPEPLKLAAVGPNTLAAVWRMPPAAPVIVAPLAVTGGFGEVAGALIFPRAERFDQLAALPAPAETAVASGSRVHIESLVMEMAVDLAVVLGTADVTLNEMARMKPGDVLILRQKVTEPLAAEVGGTTKFRVWPGAVGSRSAVQIQAAVAE